MFGYVISISFSILQVLKVSRGDKSYWCSKANYYFPPQKNATPRKYILSVAANPVTFFPVLKHQLVLMRWQLLCVLL